jgi:hypothetical protein
MLNTRWERELAAYIVLAVLIGAIAVMVGCAADKRVNFEACAFCGK